MQLPSQVVAMCMPAGSNDNIREIKSESGKLVMKHLLDRCYVNHKLVDFRHIPAMLRLSAPGALRAWCGVVLSYAQDCYGEVPCTMPRSLRADERASIPWVAAPAPERRG